MKVKQITVRAGRVVPHPLHAYGNLKADLEIVADVEDGEDPEEVRRALQTQIESLVEQHVADLKSSIRDFENFARQSERIKRLETELNQRQAELDEIKKDFEDCPLFLAANPKKEN